MDYTLLEERTSANLSAVDKRKYKAFLVKMQKTFDERHGEILWDVDNIKKMFQPNSGLPSKSYFYETKKWFNIVLLNLYEEKEITEEQKYEILKIISDIKEEDVMFEDEIRQTYFKNLNDAIRYVTFIGGEFGLRETGDLLSYKSFVILTWYGLSVNEILDIKKEDLNDKNNSICYSNHTKVISEEFFKVLSNFRDQISYAGFPNGNVRSYIPSSYLFRSCKEDHLLSTNWRCKLYSFNKIASEYGKRINQPSLHLNGLFYNILVDEQNNKISSINDYLIKVYGIEKSTASKLVIRYKVWKKIYYNL